MMFIRLLACSTFLIHTVVNSQGLSGSPAACTNEGEEVPLESIIQTYPSCITCICKKGFVECQQEKCKSYEGCYMLQEPKNSCCKICKGCVYKGVAYKSDQEWTDPDNPCKMLTCKAGVVTETEMQCYTSCRNPVPPKPGECCPTCPGCRFNGQNYSEDQEVTIPEDPCLSCHCEGGHMTCSKKACPVLQCLSSRQIQLPGKCCPECKGSRSWFDPPNGKCVLQMSLLGNGNSSQRDRCTSCKCVNSTTVCQRETCPVLDCSPKIQIREPGKCCPHCPPVEESRTQCTQDGKIYEDGDFWQLDPCQSCVCKNGHIRCSREMCSNQNTPCPSGFKRVHHSGECCPRCVENDGVCTVFGDPHYKTFDGHFYSFQGACKYLLTADCVTRNFTVRVTNDARATKLSSWTKTISIKLGLNTKVNLGQRMRVKVNGIKVKPPYQDEKVTIEKQNFSLVVKTHLGLNVIWDGDSFLEVSVPTSYKGKVCGLCGNFNMQPKDDFTTKRGKLVLDPDKFGTSWRVGGKKACSRSMERPNTDLQCQYNPQRKYRDYRKCKLLRSEIFSKCHGKVNPARFLKSCVLDMCECPTGRCHCQALTAYSHECARHGLELEWRNMTGCGEIQCPKGAVYSQCGPACPLTCSNTRRVCMKPCKPGCHCKAGHVKHGSRCIKPEHCPPRL